MQTPMALAPAVARRLSINAFGVGVASLALLVLFIRAVDHFDDSWDGTAYHLVFAAFRSGILSPNDFVPLPRFIDVYHSFPALLDIVNGYTWRITGSVLILQTFPLIAILTLAWFWRRRFGLSMPWVIIAILTVPAIQTSATALYVDTFSNCVFAVPVSILSISFIDRRALCKADLAVSLIALAIAANCKPQFVVWATILLALLCAHQLTFLMELRKRNEMGLFFSASAVALSAILFVDLRNAIVFGNPFYPVSFHVFGHAMPGTLNSFWPGPDYLRDAPRPVRWLLSILEYRAFDGRDTPYNIDQYEFIPIGSMPALDRSFPPGAGMGGFFVPFVLGLIAWLAIFIRKCSYSDQIRWFMPIVIASVVVAPFPGSHNLRYSTFWMLNLIFLCFMSEQRNNEISTAFRFFLLVMFLSVGMITGWRYFDPTPYSVQDHIKSNGIDKVVTGRDLCFENRNRDTILFSYIFHSSGRYRVVDLPPGQHCPR